MRKFNLKEFLINYYLILILSFFGILWFASFFFQIQNFMDKGNYDVFLEYARISFTLFGFVLVGGIFEKSKNNKNENDKIYDKLFSIGLGFLYSGVIFLFAYTLPYLDIEGKNVFVIATFIVGLMLFAMISFIYNIIKFIWVITNFYRKEHVDNSEK